MGGPGEVVPIVPAAVIFDLGRGGDFALPARRGLRRRGVPDALSAAGGKAVSRACVGAGTGASAGQLKGGVGSASAVLADGTTVAALVVVNPVGSAVDPDTGELHAARFGLPGEFPAGGAADAGRAAGRRPRSRRGRARPPPPSRRWPRPSGSSQPTPR